MRERYPLSPKADRQQTGAEQNVAQPLEIQRHREPILPSREMPAATSAAVELAEFCSGLLRAMCGMRPRLPP